MQPERLHEDDRFRAIIAVHLFLLKADRVLLLRRFNTGFADGQYSVIAGHVDGKEQVRSAMVREAREEAGVEISVDDLVIAGVMHRNADSERVDFFFAATSWIGDISNCEPEKCDEMVWHNISRLPENVVPYIRKALENYASGTFYDEYGWDVPTNSI